MTEKLEQGGPSKKGRASGADAQDKRMMQEYNALMAPLHVVWSKHMKIIWEHITADDVQHLVVGVVVCHMCGHAIHGLPTEYDTSEATRTALARSLTEDGWVRVGPMYVCKDCYENFLEARRELFRKQIAAVPLCTVVADCQEVREKDNI